MATVLDAALVSTFSPWFVFLMILLISYAILSKVKILGENAFINWIISIALALLFATSATAIRMVTVSTPWLIVLLTALLFMTLIFKFLGAEDKDFFLNPKNPTTTAILAIIIVNIFVFAFGEVRREQQAEQQGATVSETNQGAIISFPGQVGQVLREPAVLGLIITLLIATFTIMLLTAAPETK